MIKVAKNTTRRLLDVHGWLGVALGLALYVVVFSGAIVVFSHEIGDWSVSGHSLGDGLAGKVDDKLVELSQDIPKEYLDEVAIWQNSAGNIITFFHTHVTDDKGEPAEKGVRFVLDPASLTILSRVEGFQEDLPVISSSFLERFYIDLHVRLHAPGSLGLYLTGILGLVLFISAVSGFILHRHLIKDIFLSPRLSTRLLNTRDRHNLAGTWGIVFSILLAFTGAFFSFATTLGLPVIAITAFAGDREQAIETIVGIPPVEDDTPKQFIGIEKIIEQARQPEVAGSVPAFLFIQHWGRADAVVLTTHEPTDDNMFFTTHKFDGVTGEYKGDKPRFGNVPSTGDTLVGLMGVLHFGWFAGLMSRIIWLSLGLATCYVTLTGLQLWMQRREKDSRWQSLSKLISIVGYGTPIAMVGAAMGFLMSYSVVTRSVEAWTVNGFLIGVALSFVVGFLYKSSERRERTFQQITGLQLISLSLIHTVSSGQNWSELLANHHGSVVALNITFLIAGMILLFLSTGVMRKSNYTKENTTPSTSDKMVEAEG